MLSLKKSLALRPVPVAKPPLMDLVVPRLLTFPPADLLSHTTERATAVTIVLAEMLVDGGHRHGGINE